MKKGIIISASLRLDNNHSGLYDGGEGNYIPWNTLAEFFKKNL